MVNTVPPAEEPAASFDPFAHTPAPPERLTYADWPEVPDAMREFVDYVHGVLERDYLDGEPVHNLNEETRLWAPINKDHPERSGFAAAALEKVLNQPPEKYRLVVSDLRRDQKEARKALRWVAIRSSRFWPMSLLIYTQGLENLHYNGGGQWVVKSKGLSKIYNPDSAPPEARNEDLLTELFRAVLAWPQTSGENSLDRVHPKAEAQVGSLMRLTVAIPPIISTGHRLMVAMRFHGRTSLWDLEDLMASGMFTEPIGRLLEAAVKSQVSMLISGPMGSGKTSLLRVLSWYIPKHQMVTVMEDGAELNLQNLRPDRQPWVPLLQSITTVPSSLSGDEGGISFGALVRFALRLGGERPIIGEARGQELAEGFSALTAGQEGGMVTIHAKSAAQAIDRAVQYVMKHPDYRGEEHQASRLTHDAVELIVQLGPTDGGGRAIKGIVAPMEIDGHVALYDWDNKAQALVRRANFGELPKRLQEKLGPYLNNTLMDP